MSDIILLQNVRLSFPPLVEPHAAGNSPTAQKKYSADFIMAGDNPALKQFKEKYAQLAMAKWGENAQNVMAMIDQDRKLRCYGSGNDKVDKKTFKPYQGYENMFYLSANNSNPPQMIQADGTPVDAGNTMGYQQLARTLYGGCYVNAAIKPWLQDNQHGRAIRCDLVAVQFAADGDAFGEAKADVTSMFGTVAGGTTSSSSAADMPDSPFQGKPDMPSFLG